MWPIERKSPSLQVGDEEVQGRPPLRIEVSGTAHPPRYSPRRVLRGVCEAPPQGMGQCRIVVVLLNLSVETRLAFVINTHASLTSHSSTKSRVTIICHYHVFM